MRYEFLFLFFAAIGIIDTAYLVWRSRKPQPLVCPIGQDCSAVLHSKWSNLFGIPNDILGLCFYSTCFILMTIAIFFPAWSTLLYFLIFIFAGASVLMSIFFVYLQAVVIKNYCMYCLISAGTTVLLFTNSAILYYSY